MKNKRVKLIAYGLFIAMTLSSCGSNRKMEVPELLEPKVTNESYRPVQRTDVGTIKMGSDNNLFLAKVVAKQESYFWTSSVRIDNIAVKVGDYVEAGQVLATADLEDAYEVLRGFNTELANENAVFAKKQELYEAQHSELEYKIMGAAENGLSTTAYEKQLEILEENNRYDEKLHNFYVSSINNKISEQNKIVSNGDLVATKSGYVTYVKNIKETNAVAVSDAVVIIADPNDLYVESEYFTENPSDRRVFPKYTALYTVIDGVRYDLVEYPYLDEELAVAENKGMYPKVRYKFVDESKMPELGTNLLITMAVDVRENVLSVGKDSLEKDSQGYFVYVLVDGKKEVRRVEIGKRDDYNVEILSGLEEGELVYFSSLSASPEDYEPHEVTIDDYVVKGDIRNKKKVTTESKVFYSEVEGILDEVVAGEGSTVSKGDLICTINTNSGSARLTEMSNAMSQLTEGYESQTNALDEAISEIQLQIDAMDAAALAETEMPDAATETDAISGEATSESGENGPKDPYLRQELALQLTQLSCQKQIATLNYEYQLSNMQKAYQKASKNNNGSGIISVYAEADGVISDVRIHDGKNVKVGDRLFDIKMPIEERIVANTFNNRTMGQEITFFDKESGKEYTATILGGAGFQTEYYTKVVDGHVYITSTTPDPNGNQYFVTLDDDSIADRISDMDAEYIQCRLKDVVIVNRNDVYSEVVEEKKSYYVWKLVDGMLVKQYVNLFSAPSLDSDILCVTWGLQRGDVLAGQKGSVEEEDD
ncbi:MAG: hypothetical protein PUA62_04755 [Lachnospiraceae bacterium]|nr:hypothetical protein [Lachnospiraceae bacterium]